VHVQIVSVWIKFVIKVSECNQFLQRMLLSASVNFGTRSVG
jgi:hypothetical protein